MNIGELIEALSDYDPDTQVVVEYDGHFNDIRSVQPQVILLEGSSWGDYAADRTPDQRGRSSQIKIDQSEAPHHTTVVALWGIQP